MLEPLQESGKPFPLTMPDGSIRKMFVKSSGLDYVPKVMIDGREIILARKLEWYEYALALLPFALIFVGGALGGLCAVAGLFFNLQIFRTDWPLAVKVLSVLGVSVLAGLAYMIGAAAFHALVAG